MTNKNAGLNTLCVHAGELKDSQYGSAISPIYTSTSYEFIGRDPLRYPRAFNTPNQVAVCEKIAALEHTDKALLFGSGMAALSTLFLSLLKKGDHLLVQNTIYGGTHNFLREELEKFGIEYSFTEGFEVEDFQKAIKLNTKLIHLETPSNPLLTITDIAAVTELAKSRSILTSIDNTFASPINQNPIDLGVDVVMHSATKYLGGHSDILAGTLAAREELIEKIWPTGRNFGGNLSDMTVWLLERSLKTLALRVEAQNKNAMKISEYLQEHTMVSKVNYPGLQSHPNHQLAKSQMNGFGGMLSFELTESLDAMKFMNSFKLIKPSMSLAGVETTVTSPFLTSHALLTAEERAALGISNGLIRFSAGIENAEDLIADLEQAFKSLRKVNPALN